MVIDFQTLESLNISNIRELSREQSRLDPDKPESSKRIEQGLELVKATVLHMHQIIGLFALRQKDPATAAMLWEHYTSLCDQALETVGAIKERFHTLEASALYDLLLDYRNAANTRHTQNLLDSQCTPAPKGLFPSQS